MNSTDECIRSLPVSGKRFCRRAGRWDGRAFLRVLWEDVREGHKVHKVFVNIVTYVRLEAGSSFGNMLSMFGASWFLPYLPMTPVQILVNNLLSDCSQVPIPTDTVDDEAIARPQPWSLASIARSILMVMPCSSSFDLTTFVVLLFAFDRQDPKRAVVFRFGWFVESRVSPCPDTALCRIL